MARVFTRGLLVLTALAACAFASPSRADDFKADVKFVQVGDVKLAYYTRGEGTPLVMVNVPAGGSMAIVTSKLLVSPPERSERVLA